MFFDVKSWFFFFCSCIHPFGDIFKYICLVLKRRVSFLAVAGVTLEKLQYPSCNQRDSTRLPEIAQVLVL